MKKNIYTLLTLFMLPYAAFTQYAGGNGRGEISASLIEKHMTNWFTAAGNWSDGTRWADGMLPAPYERVSVRAAAIVDADFACPELYIDATGTVTISPGKSLTVSGAIINYAGPGGVVVRSTAGSSSSLLNSTPGVSGTVKRTIEKDGQWHFLSCPVSQAFMPEICNGDFAPTFANFNAGTGATFDFFIWQEAVAAGNLNWINLKQAGYVVNTTDFGNPPRFVAGKGYLVQYATSYGGNAEKTVTGTLGSGSISIPVYLSDGGNSFNLLGNPYPSYIDWKSAAGWTRSVLADEGGGKNVWIWNETAGNYGVYNSVSGGDAGTNGVSRYIPSQQGFFVKAASTGNITVTDDARCHASQAWLKDAGNGFKLSVSTTASGFSDEVIIEFDHPLEGGAEKWFSIYSEAPSLYLPLPEKKYCICFLGDVAQNQVLPLNFHPGTDGNYTFLASGTESFSNVLLQDLKTGSIHDLKANPVYAFSSVNADDESRFRLQFSPVGMESHRPSDADIFVYDNQLRVYNPGESEISVINMLGQKICVTMTNNEALFQLSLPLKTGYYIVKMVNAGSTSTQKVFVR